jgi:hypothetical protein
MKAGTKIEKKQKENELASTLARLYKMVGRQEESPLFRGEAK